MLRARKYKPIAEINVVPYIDVMLVLMIIFMVTAPLMLQGVKVDLPSHSASKLKTPKIKPVVITLARNNNIHLNLGSKKISIKNKNDLLKKLKIESKNNKFQNNVYLRADKNCKYDDVTGLMVAMQKAGVDKVNLIT